MKFLFQTQLDSVPSNYHTELRLANHLYNSVQTAFPRAEILNTAGQEPYFVAFIAPWPNSSLTADWIKGSWLQDPMAWIMIIDHSESDQVTEYAQTYQELVRLFCLEHNFPLERLIVLNNASNILPSLPMKYFGFPFLRTVDRSYSYLPTQPEPLEITSLFKPLIMTNYGWKPHRLLALALVCQHRIEERIHLSFRDEPTQNFFQNIVMFQDVVDPTNQLDISNNDRIRAWHTIPLARLDSSVDRYYSSTQELYNYYRQSFLSVTAESFYLEQEIQITEKTYRNFLWYRPMIILASAGHLREVRRQGFITFDDFWDESYDLEPDPAQRLLKVMNIVKKIAYMDPPELIKMFELMRPILDHNWHLVRKLDVRKGYQEDHQNLEQLINLHITSYYDHNQRL